MNSLYLLSRRLAGGLVSHGRIVFLLGSMMVLDCTHAEVNHVGSSMCKPNSMDSSTLRVAYHHQLPFMKNALGHH